MQMAVCFMAYPFPVAWAHGPRCVSVGRIVARGRPGRNGVLRLSLAPVCSYHDTGRVGLELFAVGSAFGAAAGAAEDVAEAF